jgi:hypothetical protein
MDTLFRLWLSNELQPHCRPRVYLLIDTDLTFEGLADDFRRRGADRSEQHPVLAFI